MLVTSIQFGLFCIYPCLIFRMSVIYSYYSYPIWLILHLSLPYFLILIIYACYSYSIWLIFHFILALFLASYSFILVSPLQFVLFCIYSFLIFSMLVIYACFSYPIWLILHLFLPYF